MKQIKLLLLVLLFTVIPKSLWAYTKDQIVSFDNKVTSYKVLVPSGAHPTLMFIGTTKSGHLEIPSTINDGSGITFTVTEIGSEVSYNCANVTSVHLPNTIEKLGNAIFSDAKFTKINIPKSVKYIDNTAWITLSAVPECEVDPKNAVFESDENGVLYTKNKQTLCSVPSSIVTQKNSDTYTVDPSVTSIRKAAFSSNPGLKKIILPPNLNSVEEGWPSIASTSQLEAFDIASGGQTKFEVKDGVLFNKEHNKLVVYPHGKKNVTEYKIPDGVKEIASYAIADNSALTSIDLNEVTKLNISCLVRIPKLKKITLPKNLEKNGLMSGAIEGCFTLEAYEIAKENKDFATENGVLFSKNKETLYFYPIGKTDSSYEIPSTVKKIDVKSFQGASKLTSLVIPESVERIEEQAFRQNYALTSVTFREPSRINHLNAYSFWQCPKLTEVTLPSSITTIGKVFLQCDKLEKVNVPAGSKLETIAESAFSSNKNLKSFNFLGSCSLKTIETNAFANLKNIETFNFPKAVINIKRNAFSGCSNLATV
ncbi:MAG: leucine-rich repeat protein, partial [Prevotella sp.]